MADALIIEQNGCVATFINNDAPRNRMSLDFMDALEAALPKIAGDAGIGAIVIRGAGEEHFSVGMNLKQFAEGAQRKGGVEGLLDQRLRVISKIETVSKPWIATLYGYCLGGGLELPLGCHFRLAAEEGAKIGLPEMDLGTIPAWGGSARLVRCVGRDHALDMILRAKKISGPEALRIGLVQEVWPNDELQTRAQALAQELAAQPSLAVAGVLDAVVGSGTLSVAEGIAAERRAVLATLGWPTVRRACAPSSKSARRNSIEARRLERDPAAHRAHHRIRCLSVQRIDHALEVRLQTQPGRQLGVIGELEDRFIIDDR
jgi:enoyl-CoA hydratase